MSVSLRQRIASLFGSPQTVEDWQRSLDWQAGRYGLNSAEEVIELRSHIPILVAQGNQERLAYLISRINPTLDVWCQPDEVTLAHCEPSHDVPVLRAATVFTYNLGHLCDDLTEMVVDGTQVRLYVGRAKTAVYFSRDTIPNASATQEAVPALQLITDFTGITVPVDRCMRMDRAVFVKHGGWSFEILKEPLCARS